MRHKAVQVIVEHTHPQTGDPGAIRSWLRGNPAPAPDESAAIAESWLYACWRIHVPGREPGGSPALSFVDWLDEVARDDAHPVATVASAYLAWQQPSFDF